MVSGFGKKDQINYARTFPPRTFLVKMSKIADKMQQNIEIESSAFFKGIVEASKVQRPAKSSLSAEHICCIGE